MMCVLYSFCFIVLLLKIIHRYSYNGSEQNTICCCCMICKQKMTIYRLCVVVVDTKKNVNILFLFCSFPSIQIVFFIHIFNLNCYIISLRIRLWCFFAIADVIATNVIFASINRHNTTLTRAMQRILSTQAGILIICSVLSEEKV